MLNKFTEIENMHKEREKMKYLLTGCLTDKHKTILKKKCICEQECMQKIILTLQCKGSIYKMPV